RESSAFAPNRATTANEVLGRLRDLPWRATFRRQVREIARHRAGVGTRRPRARKSCLYAPSEHYLSCSQRPHPDYLVTRLRITFRASGVDEECPSTRSLLYGPS